MKQNKNQTKEKKGRYSLVLLGALAASLLGNALSVRGLIRDF